MSTQDNGGPAFPMLPPLGPDGTAAVGYPYVSEGMTLRDYFAAKAAPALLELCQRDAHDGEDYTSYCAGLAYKMADAMLKARAASPNTGEAK